MARGTVTAVKNGQVVFAPSSTNYELHLQTSQPYQGPVGQPILARIRVQARKIYTVPSGGGFISPLFGPPRTIQGRALHVDAGLVVIRAGVPIAVELPEKDDAVDLSEGPIAVGAIVNVAAMPGAAFEWLAPEPAVR
jgi:hypothetical protein